MAATGRRYVETGSPGYVVRPKTPIEPTDTKKPGVISVKFRSATLAIYWSPYGDQRGKRVKGLPAIWQANLLNVTLS